MNIIPLSLSTENLDPSIVFDTSIKPMDRLRIIGDREFEDIVGQWAFHYLSPKYVNVCEIGGSRDSGRDIIGYTSEKDKTKFDLYQCKRYQNALTPSQYYVEFGKLCYYTFVGYYVIPQNYYIVASNGLGNDLTKLVENPSQINAELIANWSTYCSRNNQILSSGLKLTGDFECYIKQFDFSIVSEISPIRLLCEFSKTKWFKYHFGGGLKPRPIVPKPGLEVPEEEQTLPYVSQLLEVYSEDANVQFKTCNDLKSHFHNKHLREQRHYFYSSQALKRFARDELIDDSAYEQIKSEVSYGIHTALGGNYSNSLKRVNATIDTARVLPIVNDELPSITTLDKCGVCHELVNDGDVNWNETIRTNS